MQGGAYIGSTFIAIYLVANLHYLNRAVYWITAGVTVFSVLLMPLTGRLADKIGVWKVALIGVLGYAALSYPALALMNLGNLALATAAYALIMVNMSFLQVASFTLTPRLFPDDLRHTATALATNLSVLIAGGTATPGRIAPRQRHRRPPLAVLLCPGSLRDRAHRPRVAPPRQSCCPPRNASPGQGGLLPLTSARGPGLAFIPQAATHSQL